MVERKQSEIEKMLEVIGTQIAEEKHICDTIRDGKFSLEQRVELQEYAGAIRDQRQQLTAILFPEGVIIPNEVWCSLKHAMASDINFYELLQRCKPEELEAMQDVANRHHGRLVTMVTEIIGGKYGKKEDTLNEGMTKKQVLSEFSSLCKLLEGIDDIDELAKKCGGCTKIHRDIQFIFVNEQANKEVMKIEELCPFLNPKNFDKKSED